MGHRKHTPSIFQGKLDFSAARNISIPAGEHPAERIALRALLSGLALLLCAYLYFVSASVLNVMAERQAERQAASIGSSVGALEKEYFTAAQSITPEAGAPLGLSPVAKTAYVKRPGAVGAASIARNEI